MENLFIFIMVVIIMAVAQFIFPIREKESKKALLIRGTALLIALVFLILSIVEAHILKLI